jgi:hypothetical protein
MVVAENSFLCMQVSYLPVVYLTMLFQWLRLYNVEWKGGKWMLSCNGYGRKQSSLNFNVLSQNLSGKTEENYKNLSQNSQYTGRDLNPGPPEYEAGVLTWMFYYFRCMQFIDKVQFHTYYQKNWSKWKIFDVIQSQTDYFLGSIVCKLFLKFYLTIYFLFTIPNGIPVTFIMEHRQMAS